MELKKVRTVSNIFIVGGVLAGVIGILFESIAMVCAVFMFLMVTVGFLVLAFFWECPYCGRGLPTRGSMGIKHCPYCGKELGL